MGSPEGRSAERARLGIDLGGTKIAGIVLGRDGSTLAEARVPTPRGRLSGDRRGRGRPGPAPRSRGRRALQRRHRHAGGLSPATGPRARTPTRTGSTATRLRPISAGVWSGRCGSRTTPIAWRSRRRSTARGRARMSSRRDPGHRRRRRHRHRRRALTGLNGIAGEWGHNPLPGAPRRGTAGSQMLLRQAGLRRDLAVRTRARGGPRAAARREPDRRGGRRGSPGRQRGGTGDAGRAPRAARPRGRPGGEPARPGRDRDRRWPVADFRS